MAFLKLLSCLKGVAEGFGSCAGGKVAYLNFTCGTGVFLSVMNTVFNTARNTSFRFTI